MSRRSRWRWGFSTFLIGAYLLWAVAGIYFPEQYANPFMGTTIATGMAAGLLIIILSIILSILYVRIANHIEAEEFLRRENAE
jgi:uncharacterized membrane protein (DUF485 family)|tara:strand:+ start:610 stop:858 length:249 start_codon:yes stop_codon:yes gene_type:complete